jgi:hypothetical protein
MPTINTPRTKRTAHSALFLNRLHLLMSSMEESPEGVLIRDGAGRTHISESRADPDRFTDD